MKLFLHLLDLAILNIFLNGVGRKCHIEIFGSLLFGRWWLELDMSHDHPGYVNKKYNFTINM